MNVIVAGASRGIGFEVVKSLHRSGANRILALSRNAEKLEELRAACSRMKTDSSVTTMTLDLGEAGVYEV